MCKIYEDDELYLMIKKLRGWATIKEDKEFFDKVANKLEDLAKEIDVIGDDLAWLDENGDWND